MAARDEKKRCHQPGPAVRNPSSLSLFRKQFEDLSVLLLPILRYLSYLSYLRSVRSPSKKEDPNPDPGPRPDDDETGTRKTTTTSSPQETYQKGRGVTPTNIPPTCSLYRTRRISAASAHAKLYVSEVWGGNRYPSQSYIKANCYVPMFRRRPWWYIARCVNYIIARAPSSLSQLKYSTHERTHPRCPIPDAFPNPAFS